MVFPPTSSSENNFRNTNVTYEKFPQLTSTYFAPLHQIKIKTKTNLPHSQKHCQRRLSCTTHQHARRRHHAPPTNHLQHRSSLSIYILPRAFLVLSKTDGVHEANTGMQEVISMRENGCKRKELCLSPFVKTQITQC